MNDNDVNFALAETNPFGKCTAEVKCHIPEDANEALTMLASASRKTKSAYVRDLLIDHIYGRAEVIRRRIGT